MTSDFAGSTAAYYRRFRRDVPDSVVTQLCEALDLSRADRALDLGCGTGQLAVPLAARVGAVVAVDPEPAMLAQLDARLGEDSVQNVTTVRGADTDLPVLLATPATDPFAAVTVATALHWMDAARVFRTARELLRAGGGVAVITQGLPIWLQDTAWARSLRSYLQTWTGPLSSTCGTDLDTLEERSRLMTQVGFGTVQTFTHTDRVAIDANHVIGHLYSAMSESRIAYADRPRFERGLRSALDQHTDADGRLVELVQATLLVGR